MKLFFKLAPITFIFYVSTAFGGIEKNFDLRLVSEGAANGDANSQYLLGEYYLSSQDSVESKKNGFYLISQAAKKELPIAEYRLGVLYIYGIGVKKNDSLARGWLLKAAKHNHAA